MAGNDRDRPDGEPPQGLNNQDVEGAMFAAFGGDEPLSVLDSIERRLGKQPRVMLHDEPGDESPVLRVARDRLRSRRTSPWSRTACRTALPRH